MIAVEEPVTQTSLAGGGKHGGGNTVAFDYDEGPEIAEAIAKLTKEEALQLLAYLETTYGI